MRERKRRSEVADVIHGKRIRHAREIQMRTMVDGVCYLNTCPEQ